MSEAATRELRDDCNLCYTASLSRCHDVTGTRAKLHKYETTWTEVICIISLHIRIQREACTPALDYVQHRRCKIWYR